MRRGGATKGADQALTTAFLVSGFGLVAFVVVGFPLPVALAAGWTAIVLGALWFERVAPPDRRARVREVVRVGAIAGLCATVAYDLSRLLMVRLFELDVWPFAAFGAFGDALLPGAERHGWARVVGAGYHLVNGVSFGIAYTGLFRRRGALAGIAYGLGLEAVMLALYPGWLHIQPLREFTQMSVVGHVAYGATLGTVARRLLTPEPTGGAAARATR